MRGGRKGTDDSFTSGRRVHFVIDTQTKVKGRKRKNMLDEDNKVSGTSILATSEKEIVDNKTGSGSYGASETKVTIRSACRGKHFRRTMSSLCDEKIVAAIQLGFGSLHQIRCTKVDLALCQYLTENFDVPNSCIKIHERNLKVTHLDYVRLTGIRGVGRDVDFDGRSDDPEIAALKSSIAGDENEITLDGLRRFLIDSECVDDTFKVGFALYVLATLLFPVTGRYVDDRYLLAVKCPSALVSNNWAKLAFAKMVEGVLTFQQNGYGVANWCILFLQWFYLDAVGKGILLFPRICKPVLLWGRKDVKRVMDKVETEGGFKSGQVRVTKKSLFDTNVQTMPGSNDASTGIRTTVVEDLSEVRSDVCAVKGEVSNLKSTFGRLEPDMGRLRNAIRLLETSIEQLQTEGIGHIVEDEIKGVFEEVQKRYIGNIDNDVLVIAKTQDAEMPESKSNVGVFKEHAANGSHSSDLQSVEQGCYSLVFDVSRSDSHLLSYIFSKKVTDEDSVGSNEVARCDEWAVSRRDMSCLSPMQPLSFEVINICAAYLFDAASENWFMPASFSERAKEYTTGTNVEGLVPSTVKTCHLRRFIGRFLSCRKIFLPIHDSELEHWYLVVFNIHKGECEIWDSTPCESAYERRENYATACLSLVEKVFVSEIRMAPDLYAKFGCFSIKYPDISPTHHSTKESGIFLIRNMQHYGQLWCKWFNSGDQRVRLALEILNHQKNELIHCVWRAAFEEVPQASASPPLKVGGFVPVSGIKFKPRRARR